MYMYLHCAFKFAYIYIYVFVNIHVYARKHASVWEHEYDNKSAELGRREGKISYYLPKTKTFCISILANWIARPHAFAGCLSAKFRNTYFRWPNLSGIWHEAMDG